MENIENQIYYHIQKRERHKGDFWRTGQSIIIGEEKNPFSYFFDKAGFPEVNEENIATVLVHYQKFARETIFEEVRQKHFPDTPSRISCLWVIPENEKVIEFWKKELCRDKESQLLKLSLTGKIHRANQSHLALSYRSMDFTRQQAINYWSGKPGNDEIEDEYLFQGKVEVLEENVIQAIS